MAANAVLAQAPVRFGVLLDPAHGGDDAGARLASGQAEKAFNLALTAKLRQLLGARGMAVTTTRDQDSGLDAVRRAELANRQAPRACLSLHSSEAGSGVHLFVSSLTPELHDRKLSAWRTAQSAWVSQSLALAGLLNASLQKAEIAVTVGRAPLTGIDSMSCPAVAIELSPLRNADRKLTTTLDNAGYQERLLNALAAALAEWRQEGRQP